jgi:hypothetical protein
VSRAYNKEQQGRHVEGWLLQALARAVSQFTFLQREWAAVFDAAVRAEGAVHADRN